MGEILKDYNTLSQSEKLAFLKERAEENKTVYEEGKMLVQEGMLMLQQAEIVIEEINRLACQLSFDVSNTLKRISETDEQERAFEEAMDNIDNKCYGCTYDGVDPEPKECNSCMQWVEGYLTAVNYDNKYWRMLQEEGK